MSKATKVRVGKAGNPVITRVVNEFAMGATIDDPADAVISGNAPTQPTGAGITRVQDLTGGDLSNATTGTVSFPPTVYTLGGDFNEPSGAAPNGNNFCCFVPQSLSAVVGSGIDWSIVSPTANAMSTTTAAKIPPDTPYGPTNELYMVRSDSADFSNIWIKGTQQNVSGTDRNYNGFRNYQRTGASHSYLRVSGWYGSTSVNPGECFGVNDWASTNSTYDHCEVIGTDDNGVKRGASGWGFNKSKGGTVTSCLAKGCKYHGATWWNCTGTWTINNFRSDNNGSFINFEKNGSTATTFNINNPVFTNLNYAGTHPCHMIIDSDVGSSVFNIVEPQFTAFSQYPGKFVICIHVNYNGVTNKQKKSDINVTIGGVTYNAQTNPGPIQVVTAGVFG